MCSLRQELFVDGWCFDERSFYLNNTFMHFRHPTEQWEVLLPVAFDHYEKGKYTHHQKQEFLALLRQLFKERYGVKARACDLDEKQIHQFLNIFDEAWKQKLRAIKASRKWWNPFA